MLTAKQALEMANKVAQKTEKFAELKKIVSAEILSAATNGSTSISIKAVEYYESVLSALASELSRMKYGYRVFIVKEKNFSLVQIDWGT
jgi:predicted RNA-binding protein with RPS1 domain